MISSGSNLSIGYALGSSGTYLLQGGSLSVTGGAEYVGQSGTGTFTQSGGTNSLSSGLHLEIGYASGSFGTYNLSNAGALSTHGAVIVGDNGTGYFNQSGGTSTIVSSDALAVGLNVGSNGTYTMTGGTLSAGGHEFIGDLGIGTFTHSAGTNTIGSGSFLILGAVTGSTGTYNLSDTGILNTNGEEYIGDEGTGTFNQTGGAHNVKSGHSINIAFVGGASGTYNLSGGSANVSGNVYVGGSSDGAEAPAW